MVEEENTEVTGAVRKRGRPREVITPGEGVETTGETPVFSSTTYHQGVPFPPPNVEGVLMGPRLATRINISSVEEEENTGVVKEMESAWAKVEDTMYDENDEDGMTREEEKRSRDLEEKIMEERS